MAPTEVLVLDPCPLQEGTVVVLFFWGPSMPSLRETARTIEPRCHGVLLGVQGLLLGTPAGTRNHGPT